MELLHYAPSWYLSEAGCTAFSSLRTLEDRSVFLYSYLKTVAKPDFDKEQTLFKIAFFLADGVGCSALPYRGYPALIDPSKNPFVAYVCAAEHCPGSETLFYIFLGILHQIADPRKRNDWVYDKQLEDEEYLREKLALLGKNLYPDPTIMADTEAYAIDPTLQALQLKLIWLFGQS